MAIHVLPILKALVPLIANASGIVAGLRSNTAARTDDRLGKLEQETIRAGEVLKGVAEQLHAIAEQLRVQAEITERVRRTAFIGLVVASAALCGAVGALVIALQH